MMATRFILPVFFCLCILLWVPIKASIPVWQQYAFKFLDFKAPTGTKIIPMPSLKYPTQKARDINEDTRFVDFLLTTSFANQKIHVFVSSMRRGSVALEGISPDEMQKKVREALLSNGPILSSHRFVLTTSKLPAEIMEQKIGNKISWTILASNRQVELLISWGRPRNGEQFVREMTRLANSIHIRYAP